MRITNPQKTQLKSIIQELGLKDTEFTYEGRDEFFNIKFKSDFFTFHIHKLDHDVYVNTITYVNNKKPDAIRQKWNDTVNQFKHWITGISEDVKHLQKDFEKLEVHFPLEIHKYSKSFITIYNQASIAETNGLNEICGLGYRKSFEFLIKDYLIRKHPKSEHEKIKELQITPCINQYVTDDQVKLLAYRVLWLGNDHAHYLKKWKGKTLLDLKLLIDLTIKWILIKDDLIKVEKNMPNGK